MGELALKVVTGDVEFLLEKNDIGSQYGCVLAVSQSGSVLSSGLKVGALIVSVGGIPLSGLNREELRTLINDSTNSGELKLKIMDNEGERYCSFPLETSDKEICQTVDKDTELKPDRLELENLRIIHKQAYRSSPDSVRSQHNSQNTSVDTRGPQINFKPKHSSVCPAVTDSYGSHLGAVAKLAIDGGLTTDQLLQIGSSDINQPGHYLYQSSINCDQKCVAPDLKYSSSDPRDAKFLTAHSSAPYSQICRISPGAIEDRPSNTPPLASTFVTDNIGATDIVRLGPGNIVTRAPAGSTVYSPSSLIRMHYSPKPYVGMGITGTPYVPVVSTLTISNLNVPSPVLSDGSDTCLCSKPTINSEPNISTTCLDLGTTKTPEPIFRCSTSSPSPTEMSPSILNRPGIKRNYVNPTLRSSAPVTSASQYIPTAKNSITDSYLPHPKPFNLHNSPSSQVARTVRHLRRIRHIFGDSIGYTSSVTSASTGALTDEDKDSVCSPKVGHLRSHGYHSVESVRRSSLLCDCSPDHIRDMNDKKSIQINNSYPSHAVIASINWNDSETQDFKKSLLWYNYHMVLSGQTLVLTREKDLSQVDPSDNLDHVHIPLSGESIVWHSLTELPGFTCPSSSHCNPKTGVIGVLNSSKLNLTCCLHFPDRQTACCIFDHFGPQKARKDSKEKQSTAPSSQTALPLHGSRSKFPSGRSSLGLAGPSGVTPLFKAMGTAAASVGLQLTDYVNLPSALHLVPTSQTSTSAGNGDVSKSKGDQALTTKLSYSPDSTTQSNKSKELRFLPSYPRGRGRLQQALTRMRRAATASCDPTSRSNSNVTTRRFASSHGFGKSKSSLISSPVKTSTEPINCSIELENSSNITYQSSDHSPFALLLATSVSPSPSLQTSCLTCMPVEPNEPVNINSNSSDLMEESQEHSNNDIYHQQNAGMTSSQQSKWEYKATSQLTVLISENTQEMVSDGDVDKNRIKFMQSEKSRHHFIPLPLHVCGPLPLHKCPRSTLSPFVPFVVELCVTLVERYGLNCIGIYRLSGSKVAHDFITSELSRDITTVDVMSDKWNDYMLFAEY
ncbi:unnamed protein product [Heterobilharzia americana]|nr:unnamed protein product [Heterobilharzia americana]